MCFNWIFNHLKMGQFWHDLFVSVGYLCDLCSFNNNTSQTSFLLYYKAVCIWLGTKCDEWGCEWLNEWMNGLPTVSLCDKCDVWVFALFQDIISTGMNDCVTGIYFRRVLFQLGKNVMDKWYEWCDWYEWVNGVYFCISNIWLIDN